MEDTEDRRRREGESTLVSETRALIESTDTLRAALLAYRRACEGMILGGTPGQPATSTIEALEHFKMREHREAVTEAIADYEAARHRVRVELVTAAREQGRNLSDVARALGVSRQLTSRLASEANTKPHQDQP